MLTGLPPVSIAYPEIFLLAAGCAILVIDLIYPRLDPRITYNRG